MSIFSRKLGIDLGTANTLVFLPGKGIVLNEPSVVAVSEQDNKILAIGFAAKDMIGKTPESIITYCPMKDGVIADYRVTEAMLRYFIGKAMGKFNLSKPDVMVSVPAGVTSTEKRAVVEAAINAGAKNAYVVKEPILAAIGAGIPIHEAKGNMIVDIGGGTTDDVHDHIAFGLMYWYTGSDCREYRFFHHIGVFRSGVYCGLHYRPLFRGSNAGRHGYH